MGSVAAPAAKQAQVSAFGRQLKQWRKQRRMSQLDLAVEAEISPRHLSFIETGRSRPKRELVLKLAETLDVPLRETNHLLTAAGLPAVYAEQDYDSHALKVYREAVSELINNHAPNPAFVLNRWGDVMHANPTAYRMLPQDSESGPLNLYEAYLFSDHWPHIIDNWPEVAWSAYWYLQKDAERFWGDARMQSLVERVYDLVKELPRPAALGASPSVRTRLNMGGQILETTTMVAHFGPTNDVFLSELRVEMIFPTNPQARTFFETLGRET
ncbi:helix-turn-helix domain-containing protein [Marinobacteraceae bacterium S3BR75-40.1]